MYKIYADSALIYDSELEDYKITKGEITLEVEKAGSFVFAMYPDNPYYDAIVQMRTIITVFRDDKIIFRGRALKVEDSFYKCRTVTCEGELAFLLDSIIRPYEFSGTPTELFTQIITEHNSQVDTEKQFIIGDITVTDSNDYISRSNSSYEDTWTNLKEHLTESTLGGYLFVSHDSGGNAVINYYDDFPTQASQTIEFGENLKDYAKTSNAEDIATVLVPLGAKLTDDEGNETDEYLTIANVNNGLDYIEDEEAISIYGRIVKVEEWEDVTIAANLLTKAKARLEELAKQNITIELTAVDLHLLDRSIEAFNYAEYITVISEPHSLNATMLCKKQTINLLKPDNDTLTLGYSYATLTETAASTDTTAIIKAVSSSTSSKISNLISRIVSTEGAVSSNSDDISAIVIDVEALAELLAVCAESIETLDALGLFIGDDGNIWQNGV